MEVALQTKLAGLQLQIDAGNGDADSEDVGPDGQVISVQAAADACQADIEAAAAARSAATYASYPCMPEQRLHSTETC